MAGSFNGYRWPIGIARKRPLGTFTVCPEMLCLDGDGWRENSPLVSSLALAYRVWQR